jgi:peptidoglycan hydrolase-like protein with peptidoglycan-binding domain
MAVTIYAAGNNTQLTKHFKISEFRCKCGGNHPIKHDRRLTDKLEELMEAVGAVKGIVNSGHRCEAHDKRVGGSGEGQHVYGTAVDIVFYDEFNKIIGTKLISCKAQDLGFTGIANINAAYTTIHLDVRTSGKYYGDENPDLNNGKPNYNTVTSNFYDYYGIKKSVVKKGCNEAVKEWQEAAIKDGFSLPSGADGLWGAECLAVATAAICKHGEEYTNQNLTRIIQKAVGADADGLFGEITEEAVKKFQKKRRIDVDGIVGVNTWKKILNIK